jgi:hypothetical protein
MNPAHIISDWVARGWTVTIDKAQDDAVYVRVEHRILGMTKLMTSGHGWTVTEAVWDAHEAWEWQA